MHDARILRKSAIYTKVFENPTFIRDKFILGDSAYPNLPWLVTPFKDNGNLTDQHKEFNNKMSAGRVVVVNTFVLLKERFRRLRRLDNRDMKLCSEIIMCACILHNFCIDEHDFINIDSNDSNQVEVQEYENINDNINR